MPITLKSDGIKFLKPPTFDLSSSAFVTDEGTSVAFTFTTDGPDGTFYWKTGGTVGAADFTDHTTSGTFSTSAGVANIVRTLRNDLLTEGTETVQLQINKDSHTGKLLATSSFVDVNDTSLTQYDIAASSATVNEGGSITFTFTTTGPDGIFYWTHGGTSSGADFTDGLTNGSFITTVGTGSIVRTLKNDLLTEGTETMVLSIRTGSISGVTLVSSSVSITDTSLTQYSLTASTGSVSEGSSVTFTFTTTGPDGTFYWANVGSTSASDFTDNLNSGSFITTAGTGSIVRTLSNDTTTEGSESVQIQIRSGSFSGTVVALSSAVTVNDTSLTPSPSVAWTPENIGIGSPFRSSMVWLDPSDTNTLVGSIVNGGKISKMSDKSGNNHHAEQNTSAKQPTLVLNGLNGKSVLRYDGLTDGTALINSTVTYGGSYAPTIFAVAYKTGPGQAGPNSGWRCIIYLGGFTSNYNAFFGAYLDNYITFFGNGTNAWNPSTTDANSPAISMANGFAAWSVVNDPITKVATPYVNGGAFATRNGTMNNTSTGYMLGGAATTQHFPGDIAEVLMLPTAIVTTDIRQRIEGYLAHKWGLTAQLSANHPYKNSPPMV